MLNREHIIRHLNDMQRYVVQSLRIFREVESTNRLLLTSLSDNVEGFHLCFAEKQTQGKGRHGHQWHSPYGGIYCSVLSRSEPMFGVWLGLIAAVEVVIKLRHWGIEGIGVKWPNDIYCKFGKLGGVLVEYKKNVAVVGVGINRVRSEQLEQSAGLTQITDDIPEYNQLAAIVAEAIMQGFQSVIRYSAAKLLERYRQVDFLHGKPVNVLDGDGNCKHGIVCGITPQAHLCVRHGDAVEVYHAAKVCIQ